MVFGDFVPHAGKVTHRGINTAKLNPGFVCWWAMLSWLSSSCHISVQVWAELSVHEARTSDNATALQAALSASGDKTIACGSDSPCRLAPDILHSSGFPQCQFFWSGKCITLSTVLGKVHTGILFNVSRKKGEPSALQRSSCKRFICTI